MDGGALQDALEAGRGSRLLVVADHQPLEFVVDIVEQVPAQLIGVDAAGAQDRHGVAVIDQRQHQMLERCELVVALARQGERAMQRLFKAGR